jgi:hypothetical protein
LSFHLSLLHFFQTSWKTRRSNCHGRPIYKWHTNMGTTSQSTVSL